jgi:hypothetical protein
VDLDEEKSKDRLDTPNAEFWRDMALMVGVEDRLE